MLGAKIYSVNNTKVEASRGDSWHGHWPNGAIAQALRRAITAIDAPGAVGRYAAPRPAGGVAMPRSR